MNPSSNTAKLSFSARMREGLVGFGGWTARQIRRHKLILIVLMTIFASWLLGGLLIEAVVVGSVGAIIAVYLLIAAFILTLFSWNMRGAFNSTKARVTTVNPMKRRGAASAA